MSLHSLVFAKIKHKSNEMWVSRKSYKKILFTFLVCLVFLFLQASSQDDDDDMDFDEPLDLSELTLEAAGEEDSPPPVETLSAPTPEPIAESSPVVATASEEISLEDEATKKKFRVFCLYPAIEICMKVGR